MSILTEAEELINGERAKAYGPVEMNWGRTVELFNAMTGISLSVKDALLFMVAVKLAREFHDHRRDNITDAAGYLGLYAKAVKDD